MILGCDRNIPAISKSFYFYLRFTEALAKAVGAGNPDSAIHPQFMRDLIIRGQIG